MAPVWSSAVALLALMALAPPQPGLAALDELEMLSLDEIEAEEAAEAGLFGGVRLMQLSAEEVETEAEAEAEMSSVHLLQTRAQRHRPSHRKDEASRAEVGTMSGESVDVNLTAFDHNGNVCLLCGKPLPQRLGGKTYTAVRTDCGGHSGPEGPSAETLKKPAAHFATLLSSAGVGTNGFCELNFAKSCVDAIANEDYLYWAKSLDMRHPDMRSGAAWDARYCQKNGFLAPDVVALQGNFTGLRTRAQELCEVKYKKYGIEGLTFKDMMERSHYEDASAPSLEDAEVLAAWNCAMGDLGCDMAMCGYSFCQLEGGKLGLYEECPGWDPVQGMAR